ncbi:MAG: DNA repair protein [Myxococcales bacterium 68-20]|nr:MAG: DNA repair protein [Myxococcales bacterium 68-20]
MTSQIDIPKQSNGSPPDTGAASAAQALEGGSYDVIRKRLLEQAAELASKAEALNGKRKQVFGGAELALIANERVRTEHNCIARDVISVAGHLLFGFQVFMGLKTETGPSDVFAFYKFEKQEGEGAEEWDLGQLPFEGPGAFLADAAFVKELRDTFKYAKDARLVRLKRTDTRLLAVVQTGAAVTDAKVLRWSIDSGGRVSYMDARGDEEAKPPKQRDFEWVQTGREDQVPGTHPHVKILDTCFVETVGGDLTIKIENNTKDGRGIYREAVDDPNQTLDDGDISYAKVGQLILLRVKPFREERYRYLVFDARAKRVLRIDAIGQACHELPEDHGIVFPGGYYLQSGDYKLFEGSSDDLEFERVIKSPNGEDILYVYHQRSEGEYLLLPYNLIRKEVATPIRCHGYSLFADGTMAVFRAVTEPTRVHPLQIWRTPFNTVENAAAKPRDGSYLAKVGNADLVRGISDALSVRRLATAERPSRTTYEDLAAAVTRSLDAHYWLGHAETGDLASTLHAMKKTSDLVLDEFDKVEAIERRAEEALQNARATQKDLLVKVRPDDLHVVEDYLRALTTLRHQRGQLISLKDLRGIDLHAVASLETELVERFDEVSKACVAFFLKDDAFKPLVDRLDVAVEKIEATTKATELAPFGEELDVVHQGLTLLAEVTGSLQIDDATARTRILEGVSAAFSHQNRARAVWQAKKKEVSGSEARAEFAAQFRLFGQAVTGAVALCDTPEKCDEQLSKLLLGLEELEGKFGDLDEFAADLASKREEVNDAIGAKRQQLLDERHRRAQNLMTAADRILSGVARRAATFKTADELNAYFASDAMVLKLADVEAQLKALGDGVRADEVASRIKSARQDALRAMRDKADLFDGGENVIKLGEHRFSVHTQPLELVLVPRDGVMTLHVTGTDFFEEIDDADLSAAKDLWEQTLPNESGAVYRSEFLATSMLLDAEEGKAGLTIERLTDAAREGTLVESVRTYAQDRLDEGYERGIHDADAALILDKLLALRASAGLLRFAADARALALLWLSSLGPDTRKVLHARARSLGRLRLETREASAQADLAREIEAPIAAHATSLGLTASRGDVSSAARYLVLELAEEKLRLVVSAAADSLRRGLLSFLDEAGSRRAFEDELRTLEAHPTERLGVALAYVGAFVSTKKLEHVRSFVREAAVLLVTESSGGRGGLDREPSAATVEAQVDGLLGAHPRIQSRSMRVAIDEVLSRLVPFISEAAPRFRAFRKLKADIVERERKRLRMSEFAPRVLTSFVRNRLIDQVYLPLVGANLAKQIGTVGAKKRTDLMGMLLLVSPPGYGKTTLMEYIASKLGLVFMKVNGPALGHDVTSLDPKEAKSSTARQEVEKINLAFEMGNNVMLYLDDIQHTSSELLQKFISLCDGQRRIEGVWKGQTRTYDLRGKKFCVVMAGNPYTESGARFQIPDMLANRADTYNLGDILGGQEDLFASSYIENSLTSNSALAPLATREPADVQKLVRMARGEDLPLTELSHGYSAAEVEEILGVLRRMLKIQSLLLGVNQEYIKSASQEDAYRTEPPFKLQGSYRNMNKLAEKVVSAMNDEETEQLIDDHYASESQTLTTGAEQNLLKLAELRGRMSDVQKARWKEIKDAFVRTGRSGKKGDDPVARVTGALSGVDEQLQRIREAISHATIAATSAAAAKGTDVEALAPVLDRMQEALRPLGKPPRVELRLDDGSAAAAVAVVNVVREQTAAFQSVIASLTELAKRVNAAPAPQLQQGQVGPSGTLPPRAPERAMSPSFPGPPGLPRTAGATTPPPPGSLLDMRMEELVGAVKRLEQRISTLSTSLPRFDVSLDAASPSTFWRSMDGDDVLRHGGVFVATYARLPPLGAHLSLALQFPGGVRMECQAQVSWTQEHLGDDTPAGFGAKLVSPSTDLSGMIHQFVRYREPLLRE